MSGKLPLVALGVLAACVVLLSSYDTAFANHKLRWTAVADYNVPPGYDNRETFVVLRWTQGGAPIRWCTNFNSTDKAQLQNAINDWMTAFSSSFGNEFREPNQGEPCDLTFYYDTSFGSHCDPSAWACYNRTRAYDAVRDGYYLTGGTIHFDSTNAWNSSRYRSQAAHELGHFHDMWEQYEEGTYQCWDGNPDSIMDTNIPGFSAPGTYPDCDAVVGPTSFDKTTVSDIYRVHQIVVISATSGPGTMTVKYYDDNWSDYYYQMRILNSAGSQVDVWTTWNGIAKWEYDQPGFPPLWTWNKPGSLPAGWYRACSRPYSSIAGYATGENCSGLVWVS